jgi:hypothetical protein
MAGDTYQAVSSVQSLITVHATRHYLSTPGLAFTFIPCAQADFWAPAFAYADLVRIPDADFVVGGRGYGVYGHDWRVRPPMVWLELLAEQEIATAPQKQPAAIEPLMVLSQPEFAAAVREALRHFSRPQALGAKPLLQSRLVAERTGAGAGATEGIAALQNLLQEAATALQHSPREARFYRALYHMYLQPARTQERAAEAADVPFSTFRRHLATGVSRVAEILWKKELGGLL